MNLHGSGGWRFKPFEDAPAMYTNRPPARFWRFFWWLLLGAKWERTEN